MQSTDILTVDSFDDRPPSDVILHPLSQNFENAQIKQTIPNRQRIFEIKAEVDMAKKQADAVGEFVKQAAMLAGSLIALAKAAAVCSLVSPLAIASLAVLSTAIITFMVLKTIEYKLERQLTSEKNIMYRMHGYSFFGQVDEQNEMPQSLTSTECANI